MIRIQGGSPLGIALSLGSTKGGGLSSPLGYYKLASFFLGSRIWPVSIELCCVISLSAKVLMISTAANAGWLDQVHEGVCWWSALLWAWGGVLWPHFGPTGQWALNQLWALKVGVLHPLLLPSIRVFAYYNDICRWNFDIWVFNVLYHNWMLRRLIYL